MTTRGEINSNFYQIVNVDANGAPTSVKPEYLPNVGNANYAANAGNANVANTASVANSVSVANVVGIGNIATVNLNGNVEQVLSGTGTWITQSGSNAANANYANFAGTAFSVSGSNVTGYVPNATHANISNSANSVAVANVTGIGNIATTNYDGSSSHVLYGNGSWANIPTVSNVANANYSNFAGTAYSVSGSNVSGAVNLANYATVANSVAGSNVSGQVSFAATANSVAGSNVSGYVANATHSNVSDSANSVAGANVTGTVANATFATSAGSANTAVTVTASSQPNITSLGTLTSLTVTGNIQSYANISGGYIFGDGSYLTGIGNLSAAQGYWGSFYSNVTQTIASTTTAYVVTLNNSDPDSHGVYISSNSHINFQFAGTYNLQFSAQFDNSDNNIQDASVWLRKNGADLPDTRGQVSIPQSHGGTNGQIIESWNYVVKLAAGDYLELGWQAESTSVSMAYLGAGTTPTTPASPSIIVTAQQVTNVQPVELQGSMSGNIIGNGYSLINIASISSVDGITANTFTGNGAPLTELTGANVTGYVANATHANIADSANSVAGSNVTGAVNLANYATTANSVSVANVTGIGNIATTNYDGSASHVLYGNGAWADIPTVSNVANANYSNFAGTAFSVSGSNVTGTVATANTVTDNAQPNITSLGNLTSLIVSGNAATEEVLFVGNGANSVSFINPTMIAKNTGATYIQAALINDSANGSSDWVAYGDNSTDVNAWADMGFTSSNFSDPLYTITGSNDGYFFVQGDGSSIHGANLVIATGSQGSVRDIVFATGGFLASNEKMRYIDLENQFYIQPITITTSPTTGALRVDGGIGVGESVYIGANLNVDGITQLGSVSNVHITGGSNSQVLTTDGTGNLSWQTVTSGGSPGGSNTQVQFNDGGTFGGSANLTFDKTTNTLSATNITGNGAGLTSITGANVTGQVSYAAVANSVAAANVAGLGTIAGINLTGSSSNVLYGNGSFAAISTVANATAANTVLSNTSSLTTVYPLFSTSSANGFSTPAKNANISANLSSGTITAPFFNGDLVGISTGSPTTKVTIPSSTQVQINVSGTTRLLADTTGVTVTGTLDSTGVITGTRLVSNVATGTAPLTVTSTTQVANLNAATAGTAGTVTTAAQPNITSVGTLTSVNSSGTVTASRLVSNIATGTAPLTVTSTTLVPNLYVARANVSDLANSVAVANVVGIGNIATLDLDGSSSNVLYGNGVFAPTSGGGTPAGSNTQVQFNNGGSFGASANLTFDNTTNTLSATNIVGNGSGLTSLTGANVTGQVSYAAVANSVSGSNVSGAVNLATYATTANAVAGANVSGQVSFAAVANSVAVANVSGIGNIATINLNGSSSNVLYGNGVWADVSISTVANANYANFAGNVTIAAQGNITSLGTLTGLTVSGVTNLGPVGNINISGGSSGYVLSTNGSGNLSWVAQSGGGGTVGFEQTFLLMGA